ncbi:MAG: cobalamin biosynthesis protein [Lachnospiraceae bacterium]|nr:cobalamin biosynthesis protein [Lachnospiraceae bacterium]
MKKTAICFSRNGMRVIERLNAESEKRGIRPAEGFVLMESEEETAGFTRVTISLAAWTAAHFREGEALLFVGAVGIAVRALTGLPEDKLRESPVLVIDERAEHVIPILSGHAGGGNKLAVVTAELLDAEPVITTATDVNGAFSADVFASENRLTVRNRDGIKRVSARALEGKSITLSIKDYPPKEPVDIIVAEETDAEYALLLSPKICTVGLGMKKDKDPEELERFFTETLEEAGLTPDDVYALCTIDRKEEEPALRLLRDRYRIPVLSFDRELLEKARGEFSGSAFVRETVGVDNVCERAAILGAGNRGELIMKKRARDGMTIAIARRRTDGERG